MVTNMREQVGPVLDDLKKEKRKAFQRQLTPLHFTNGPFGDYVSPEMKESALRVLELSVYEMVSDAVSRVLPKSRTPSAFAQIEHAIVSSFFDLSQDLETWYQRKVGLPSARMLDNSRAEAMRRRLERQLDTYRPEFTSATLNPKSPKNPAGRKPKYDWAAATTAILGQIHRGEMDPERQGQVVVEKALATYFETAGEWPSESSVRTHAKRIYDEVRKA